MSIIKSTQKKVEKGAKSLGQAMALKSYRKLAINFLILTVNLVIIILYFALSEARVVIVPKQEKNTHKISISLADINGRVATTTVETEKKFIVKDSVEVPAAATGQITIYNKTVSRSQPLVAGTQFASKDGIVIRLKEGLTIKPGESQTVAAYADKPGKEGEVQPGHFEIVKLKSDRDKIYGETTAPFSGGTILSKALNQAIFDKAKTDLENKLKALALAKLRTDNPGVAENDVAVTITEFTTSAKIGEEVNEFTAQAQAQAQALVYDAGMAQTYLIKNLADSLTPDKIVARVDEKSFLTAPGPENATLTASIVGYIQPKFPDAVFNKKAILGKNKEEVRKYFAKITGIQDIEVNFSPFWVRSVPRLEDHVDIEIKK